VNNKPIQPQMMMTFGQFHFHIFATFRELTAESQRNLQTMQ